MALSPKYFPGMDRRLRAIVFQALSGLVYLHFESYWGMTWVNADIDQRPDETDSSTPRPDRYAWRIEDLPGVDPFYANDEIKIKGPSVASRPDPQVPAIVNPVTSDMISYFAVWTPANSIPPYIEQVQQEIIPASQIWVVDRANWQLVYGGVIAGRAHFGTRDEAMAYFQSDPTIVDHSKVGVIIEQVLYQGVFQSPPNPPSQDGWAFWNAAAAQGWAGHLEDVPAVKGYGELQAANLIINPALLTSSMTQEQRTAREFKFRIVPSSPDNRIKQRIRMYGIKKPTTPPGAQVRSDFPVGSNPASDFYRPQWTGDDANYELFEFIEVGGVFPAGAYLEVTVKLSPLEVTYQVFGDGGGGEG